MTYPSCLLPEKQLNWKGWQYRQKENVGYFLDVMSWVLSVRRERERDRWMNGWDQSQEELTILVFMVCKILSIGLCSAWIKVIFRRLSWCCTWTWKSQSTHDLVFQSNETFLCATLLSVSISTLFGVSLPF